MKKQFLSTWQMALGVVVVFTLMSVPVEVWAQSLQELDNQVKTQGTSAKSIIRTSIDIIMGIGLLLVIWAYVNKRQDAKEWLIYYLIGALIYSVFRQTVLGA